ncbi:14044_t:CDS:2 [Funneliformis caledonium]|uniref:14044_t:CDS:1 n=1 Tax=Funneliformis caledonium TaxID=1117310 RepID=A0A9N9EH94_9GLOM|nr:14044_t:CDS:2 [Funneliformis caledonium]
MLSLDWKPNVSVQDHHLLIDKDKVPLQVFQNFDTKAMDFLKEVNINTHLIVKHLMDFVGKIRSITAIQKALSLNFFMAIVYRSGVILSAFYFLKMQNEENDELGGLVEENLSRRILNFIMSLTTPGIIAVYTHLLLCHYDYLDTGTGMWRWASIAVCWILYMRHLYVENE